MELLKHLNLGIRFCLELCLLGSLGFASFQMLHGHALKWLAVLGLPILVATVWGLFIAPKSQHQLDQPVRLIIELLLFGFAFWLLHIAGYPGLSVAFAIVVVLNEILVYAWRQ